MNIIIINLTGGDVVYGYNVSASRYGDTGFRLVQRFPAHTEKAYVRDVYEEALQYNRIIVHKKIGEKLHNLPDENPNIYYIVSEQVKKHPLTKDRKDLITVSDPIKVDGKLMGYGMLLL